MTVVNLQSNFLKERNWIKDKPYNSSNYSFFILKKIVIRTFQLQNIGKSNFRCSPIKNPFQNSKPIFTSNSFNKKMRKDKTIFSIQNEHEDSMILEDSGSTFSVDEAIDSLGFGKFQLLLMAYAGIAWMGEAMELMLLSFIGPSVRSSWDLTSSQESYLSSVVFIGMLVGAYAWGILSDAKGRRIGFAATAVLTAVCGLFSALSPTYFWLLFFRALVGLGLGGAPVIFSLFMEFMPTNGRGFWLVSVAYFWTLGSVVEASLAWIILPSLNWRWLVAFSSLPLLLLLFLFPFLPESPRFHVVKGQPWKALHTLSSISSLNNKPLPKGRFLHLPSMDEEEEEEEEVKVKVKVKEEETLKENEFKSTSSNSPSFSNSSNTITNTITSFSPSLPSPSSPLPLPPPPQPSSSSNPFSIIHLLLSPSMIQSTVLLWSVFFANAFSYYGMVLLTSQLLGEGNCFEHNDMSSNNSDNVTNHIMNFHDSDNFFRNVLLTSLAELPGLLIATSIVDRIGRKKSMSVLLSFTVLFLLPLYFHLPPSFLILSLFGSRAFITGSFQILFLYAPEVYPTNIRSSGLGIANSFSRLGGIICPFVSVYLVSNCQKTAAISFFVVVIILAIFAIEFFPIETMDRTLKDFSEELDEEIEKVTEKETKTKEKMEENV